MHSPAQHCYEFGRFRLDAGERLLLSDSAVVPLPPKAFELLLVMVENAGRVLTKEELMKRVWPDSFVEEANLSHNIYKLREVLGERHNGEKYIETVPRRGYRFVGKVVSAADESVDVLLAEHTRAHVIIEEETSDEQATTFRVANAANAAPIETQRQLHHTLRGAPVKVLFFSIGLAALAGAALWQRQGSNPRASVTSLPPAYTVPLTSFPDDEFSPALSPDGKLVAYSWQGGKKSGGINLYVQQVDGGTPLQLTAGMDRVGGAAWSPDGRFIAFIRGAIGGDRNGIYIIPALGGHERRLLTGERVVALDWAPDGKYIAFGRKDSANSPFRISFLNVDTLEVRVVTDPPAGTRGDIEPSLSPDGQTLAFIRYGDDASELFTMPAAGGQPRQVTFDNRRQDGLAWTLDGQLVFSSNRSGSYNLWRVSPAGGEPERVAGTGEDAHEASISHAGARLSYSQQLVDTNIWRVPAIPTAPTEPAVKLVASTRRDENGSFSPDGKQIAFQSKRTGNFEIWVCDREGGNEVQLTNFNGPVTGNPRWSPDGKQIVFDSRPDGHADIYVISSEGGPARRLTSGLSDNLAPSWSRDGGWIYFGSNRSGSWQVWRMLITGDDAVQLTDDGGYEAVEAPDGQSIYYNKYGFYTMGLFQRSLGGNLEEKVLDLPQLESVGDWLVTSEGIYFIYRYDAKARPASACSINYYDFATRRTRVVAPLPHDPTSNPGLSLSPDGKWLIYSIDDHRSLDVMLVENFH